MPGPYAAAAIAPTLTATVDAFRLVRQITAMGAFEGLTPKRD